jgi:hypothetical protein
MYIDETHTHVQDETHTHVHILEEGTTPFAPLRYVHVCPSL